MPAGLAAAPSVGSEARSETLAVAERLGVSNWAIRRKLDMGSVMVYLFSGLWLKS